MLTAGKVHELVAERHRSSYGHEVHATVSETPVVSVKSLITSRLSLCLVSCGVSLVCGYTAGLEDRADPYEEAVRVCGRVETSSGGTPQMGCQGKLLRGRGWSARPGRFDQRSGAVLASTSGAVVLPVFAVLSPSLVRPGLMGWLIAIWAYSTLSMIFTFVVGRLSDRQFAVLGAGGMVGVAGSAYLIADPGTCHAILVLLAAIPALAAMHSRPPIVVGFIAVAVVLATTVSAAVAPSWAALAIAGGATVMAVIIPTVLVVALRQSLMGLVARLEVIGDTDPLTGVWNRRGLETRLHTVMDTAIGRGCGLGVAIVDIDFFKTVNDRWGHSTGDQVLVDVVGAVRAAAPTHALVARVGGEEFIVVAPVDDQAALADIAEAARGRVARDTSVTVSVGAVFTEVRLASGPTPVGGRVGRKLLDHLSHRADEHLYTSKQQGRNRVTTGTVDAVRWPAQAHRETHRPDDGRVSPAAPRAVDERTIDERSRVAIAVGVFAELLSISPERAGDLLAERAAVGLPGMAAEVIDPSLRTLPARPTEVREPRTETRHGVSVFTMSRTPADRAQIDDLVDNRGYDYVDGWVQAAPELRELYALPSVDPDARSGPHLDFDDPDAVERASRYVVFPWRTTVVRLPDAEIFHHLRTARNRYLLTEIEQQAWSNAIVAVAGLSIGSSAVAACSLTGARRFRIADHDTLAPTNLNRIAGSVCDLGRSKLQLAHRRILEADPFATVEGFDAGYGATSAPAFLGLDGVAPAAAVVIDEIDDVAMKIDIRRRARAAGIPVVTATDLGNNVILDVERYDQDPTYPIFHGRGEDFSPADAADPVQRLRMTAAIVGDEATARMRYSATQIGRSLPSWPQLGTTATTAGAFAATAARLIVCGAALESGRYRLDIDTELLSGHDSAERWNELDADTFAALITPTATP